MSNLIHGRFDLYFHGLLRKFGRCNSALHLWTMPLVFSGHLLFSILNFLQIRRMDGCFVLFVRDLDGSLSAFRSRGETGERKEGYRIYGIGFSFQEFLHKSVSRLCSGLDMSLDVFLHGHRNGVDLFLNSASPSIASKSLFSSPWTKNAVAAVQGLSGMPYGYNGSISVYPMKGY